MDCPDNHSLFFLLNSFQTDDRDIDKVRPAGILRTLSGMANKHFRKNFYKRSNIRKKV